MSTITASQDPSAQAPTEESRPEPPVAVAEQSGRAIFEYSRWIHVGLGAEQCPLARATLKDGYRVGSTLPKCDDQGHFHAWVRLANPYQMRDILDKAKAAQARKLRELRDDDSDASVILDSELQSIRDTGDGGKEILVDEILVVEYNDHYSQAIRDVDAEEDEAAEVEDGADRPLKWAHVDQDREELQRQLSRPEEEQEGVEALRKRVKEYEDAIEARAEQFQAERRREVEDWDWDRLLRIVRRDRVDNIANEVYLHTFNTWQWYVCTYQPRTKGVPNERVWADIGQLKFGTDTQIVTAIRETFTELEQKARRDRLGNS